jgi:alpha-beta hydrolase superfamily lysophospholipase
LDHGYDFYALDMRKCGRSIISPEQDQYKHYCNDLHEFNEEITLAIEHIIKEAKSDNRKILLLGHSTGKKNPSKRIKFIFCY